MEQPHMKGCVCSECRKSQFRSLGQTWTYPDGSADPSNWNYFSTIGYNYGGKYTPPLMPPDTQRPMVYIKEGFCNSCRVTPFLTSAGTWNYQKPYSS